jgi:exonuclease III
MTRPLAGGVRAPGLKVASHNVRGLLSPGNSVEKMSALVELWAIQQRLDVVLVQETHLSPNTEGRADRQLLQAANLHRVPPYTAFWNSLPKGGQSGVGILISQRLLVDGHLALASTTFSRDAEGRLLGARCKWGGHSLALATVYCPSGTSRCLAQRAFIEEALAPWLEQQGSALHLIGGDFNFVLDSTKDRSSPNQVPHSQAASPPLQPLPPTRQLMAEQRLPFSTPSSLVAITLPPSTQAAAQSGTQPACSKGPAPSMG